MSKKNGQNKWRREKNGLGQTGRWHPAWRMRSIKKRSIGDWAEATTSVKGRRSDLHRWSRHDNVGRREKAGNNTEPCRSTAVRQFEPRAFNGGLYFDAWRNYTGRYIHKFKVSLGPQKDLHFRRFLRRERNGNNSNSPARLECKCTAISITEWSDSSLGLAVQSWRPHYTKKGHSSRVIDSWLD